MRWTVERLAGAAAALAAGLAASTAAAEPARCSVKQLVELKVTMDGRRPMVPVGINGHPEQFLVDSGAFFSNISPGKAAELKLHLENLPVGYTVRGIGGDVRASLTHVDTVTLAGVDLRHIPFIVGGSEVGRGAGLLGQNVLGLGDVEYDLAHGAVRLMRPSGNCKDGALVYWTQTRAFSTVPIEVQTSTQRHTIGPVLINGVKMNATFDTGAYGTVLSLQAAARLGMKPGDPRLVRAGYGGGLGQRNVASYLAPIDTIKIGDQEEVRRTRLRVEDIGLDTDLLVGADFFLSHRVYVSNALHRLFFTYEGGPIFGTAAGPMIDETGKTVTIAAAPEADPTDAAGFSRRGAAAMSRRDYARAIADLDKAVAMAPGDATYLYQRAEAHQQNRQSLLAMDDIDAALRIDPNYAEAKLARAQVRLSRHDRAAAEQDITSVDAAAPEAADARLMLAGMYGALGQHDKAAAQYGQWLRFHPDDRRKPTALAGRCWARAQMGVDLPKALSDCDAAIKARPDVASYLDSRGLVRLRMGDDARAIADFDAALGREPKLVWALYGRGLAKRRGGDTAGGDADIAAAVKLDPGIAGRAKAIGL